MKSRGGCRKIQDEPRQDRDVDVPRIDLKQGIMINNKAADQADVQLCDEDKL